MNKCVTLKYSSTTAVLVIWHSIAIVLLTGAFQKLLTIVFILN